MVQDFFHESTVALTPNSHPDVWKLLKTAEYLLESFFKIFGPENCGLNWGVSNPIHRCLLTPCLQTWQIKHLKE